MHSVSNIRALTCSSYAAMFFLGVGITLIGAAARNIGLDAHQIGLLISTQHLGFAIAVAVSGVLSDMVPKPRLLLAGSLVLGLSFLFFYASPVFWINLVLMFLNGIGIGVYEGVTDAWLIDMHQERQSRFISVNHFFVTIGAAGITLYLIFLEGGWRSGVVESGAAVLLLALFFTLARSERPRVQSGSVLVRLRAIQSKWLLGLVFLIAALAVGVELGTMGYLTSFLMELRGFEQLGSKVGLVVFLGGIASGRLAIGLLVRNEQVMRFLVGLFVVAAGAFSMLFTADLGRIVYGAIFLCGFSVSAMFPLLISLVAMLAPEAAGTTIGLLKLTIPLGGMVISFVLSQLARALPLGSALLAIPCTALLGVLAVILAAIMGRRAGA